MSSLVQPVRCSPIAFSIDYDATRIREEMSYTIRVVIRDKEGKLLWITDTRTPLFTPGGHNHVDVNVERVAKKKRENYIWTHVTRKREL
jgi:uncharacterized lipoprotein YbaY